MKKSLSFLLVLLMIFQLALPASAADFQDLMKAIQNISPAQTTVSYTHKGSNTSLSIPKTWKVEEKNDYTLTFASTAEDSVLMTLQAMDLKMPQASNDDFSKAEFAEVLGVKTSELKAVTLGGQEYYTAQSTVKKTVQGVKVSLTINAWVTVQRGWIYVYHFAGSDTHPLYDDFTAMIASARYGSVEAAATGSDGDLYEQAIEAYQDGDYDTAEQLFSQTDPYRDSGKYLRLIRIRNAGGNIGVGSDVYVKECGLTEADKKDIDEAAKDFYFADTPEVLLCNSDVACYYLVGDWKGGSKCYIHFKMNKAGGTYNIGSKLSTNYKSTFSIDEGELRVDVCNTDALTLHLTLTAPNTMEVLTYEKNCKTYTLKRK